MDTVSVAEFRKELKVMLDSALTDPVFIRRGDDIYQLSHYGGVGVVPAKSGMEVRVLEESKSPKKIAGAAPSYEQLRQEKVEALRPVANQMADELAVMFTRTHHDVLREINTLKAEIDQLKLDGEFNQDLDYWSVISKKDQQLQELWQEYHKMKGTK